MAKILKIQPAFVIYLENGLYNKLPGEVYIKNWLKEYGSFFKTDVSALLNLYESEKLKFNALDLRYFIAPVPGTKFFSSQHLRKLLLSFACLIVAAYIGLKIVSIIEPPFLEVYEPLDHAVLKSTEIAVKGKTLPQAMVTINSMPVELDSRGNFSHSVKASYGLNELIIAAANKRGKKREVKKTVLIERKIIGLSLELISKIIR